MSPAWFVIGCIGCPCHSASSWNCVWWCTKQCTDWCLYICPKSASSPALKVALGHLLVVTWWFGRREQSSIYAHLSSRVRRHETSYCARSATLHPWTVSRRLWIHFCLRLISDCTLHFHCCTHCIFSIGFGLYDTLESVIVQTHVSHVDFDSFTVFMCLFRSKKFYRKVLSLN